MAKFVLNLLIDNCLLSLLVFVAFGNVSHILKPRGEKAAKKELFAQCIINLIF